MECKGRGVATCQCNIPVIRVFISWRRISIMTIEIITGFW
jgi:hypothetical protein